MLDLQRDALTDLVFASPAQTLGDVLVQVDAASILVNRSMHCQLDADIVNQAFETLARVLASMSGVLIREAGVDASEVCDRFTLGAVASEFGALVREGV